MTLNAAEFIRRFLVHVLPDRFVKIRHYGILGNRNRNTKLKLCKRITKAKFKVKYSKMTTEQLLYKLTGRDITKCPCCGSGKLQRTRSFVKQGISPPVKSNVIA